MSERAARKWVKGSNGKWSSYDPVIQRQIERKAAKEAKEEEQKMVAAITAFSIQLALVSGA